MRNPTEAELKFLQLVTKQYYEVVPAKYKTYCVFNANVLKTVLNHYGIEAELMPCQTWCSQHQKSIVLGFVGSNPGPEGWDGHVACRAGDWFIDASIHHFKAAEGVDVPDSVIVNKFSRPSNVLGRYDVTPTDRLWWVTPPSEFNSTPPRENHIEVELYARKLVEHLNTFIKPSQKLRFFLNSLTKQLAAAFTNLFGKPAIA